MINTKKIIFIILLISIISGVSLRFYNLNIFSVDSDELLHITRGLKFHHQSFDSGREFVAPHVPLGAWTLGIPSIFIQADYEPLKLIPTNMYVWSYLAYDALSKNYVPMRMMSAFCGSLTILFIFLITRKLFGMEAGLWSAAITALSSDMFGASRVVMLGGAMLFYSAGTIYFFMKYHTSDGLKKHIFLLFTMLFLIFALMSRLYQPLFLIPILIISQFLLKRGGANIQKNITFGAIILICVFIAFNLIFPTRFLQTSEMKLGGTIFGLGLLDIFIVFITRNSYLFLFSEILLLCLGINFLTKKNEDEKRKFDLTKLKEFINSSKLSLIPFIYFFITFIPLMFLDSGFLLSRYLTFLFIPMFIFGGYAISKAIKKKAVFVIVLFLLFVNMFFLFYNFPVGMFNYSNFGLYSTFGYQSSGMDGNVNEYTDNIINYLGDTYTISNYADFLIKYNGKKDSIPIPNEQRCNQGYFDNIKNNNAKILYYESSGRTINNDPYICPNIRELTLQEEKVFNSFKIYSLK